MNYTLLRSVASYKAGDIFIGLDGNKLYMLVRLKDEKFIIVDLTTGLAVDEPMNAPINAINEAEVRFLSRDVIIEVQHID